MGNNVYIIYSSISQLDLLLGHKPSGEPTQYQNQAINIY